MNLEYTKVSLFLIYFEMQLYILVHYGNFSLLFNVTEMASDIKWLHTGLSSMC